MNDFEQFKIEAEGFVNHTISFLKKIEITKDFQVAVDMLSKCNGLVVTTGMGKNGHIARKISSTFSSLSIPSCFIHPGEAMHGDSGVLRKNDILMVVSTSGKTDEIIEIIKVARNLGIKKVISLTSHKDSPIKKMSNIVIDIGEIKEAGYLGLAPTTSTLAMLLVGDILATFSAKEKKITIKDYHDRHHHGYLGAITGK